MRCERCGGPIIRTYDEYSCLWCSRSVDIPRPPRHPHPTDDPALHRDARGRKRHVPIPTVRG
jgi:hypothetical protein